jgi:hypothetical protein
MAQLSARPWVQPPELTKKKKKKKSLSWSIFRQGYMKVFYPMNLFPVQLNIGPSGNGKTENLSSLTQHLHFLPFELWTLKGLMDSDQDKSDGPLSYERVFKARFPCLEFTPQDHDVLTCSGAQETRECWRLESRFSSTEGTVPAELFPGPWELHLNTQHWYVLCKGGFINLICTPRCQMHFCYLNISHVWRTKHKR